MTTYLLLALHDDGRTTAYEMPSVWAMQFQGSARIQPCASGTDRGPYQTFEIAGRSIDVCVLPPPAPV